MFLRLSRMAGMRRLGRRLLNGITAVSVTLCVAAGRRDRGYRPPPSDTDSTLTTPVVWASILLGVMGCALVVAAVAGAYVYFDRLLKRGRHTVPDHCPAC